MVQRRHIISPVERAALGQRQVRMAQERMTPAEIGRLMRKTIHEALDRNGTVSRDDLLRANIPVLAIDTRFRAILLEVVDERARGGVTA